MAKAKAINTSESSRPMRPAITPEARESQLMAMAYDLAEEQLRAGTASSQVITHFLKLATKKEQIEREILERQKELITAKTEAIQAGGRLEELMTNALAAMKKYSGHGGDEPDEY